MAKIPAPSHLKDSRSFWADMQRDYAIADAAGLAYLTRACECVDRITEARQAIAEYGAIIPGADGVTTMNSACRLEKEARDGFLSAMRALRIDMEPTRDGPGRPPGTLTRTKE